MRGGKRCGAGRKKSEPTVRLSVPVGAVEEVKKLIDLHKRRQLLINSQKIKQPIEQLISQPLEPLKTNQKIKDSTNLQAIRALLERKLKSHEKKAVIKVHGSLFQAASDGVRFDNGLIIPPHFNLRYESLGFEAK